MHILTGRKKTNFSYKAHHFCIIAVHQIDMGSQSFKGFFLYSSKGLKIFFS